MAAAGGKGREGTGGGRTWAFTEPHAQSGLDTT